MERIRHLVSVLAATLFLVVASTLASPTDAHAQARASLTATARVVDAGPGWAAHLSAQAGVERAIASGQLVAGQVRMTESGLASEDFPRPVVLVSRTAIADSRSVTIQVQHVAN